MKRKHFLRYSFLLGGLTFFKTSRLSAFYTHARSLFLNKVKFIWAGAITTNAVKVHAKLTTATTSARLVVSTDPSLSNPVYGSFATADASNNFIAKLSVSGLSPNTEYYYGIEADGVLDTATDAIGRFKTTTNSPHSFRFSIASCNNSGNHPVFYRLKEKDPLFHITHGDFHYGDPNSAADINVHRAPMENTLAQPAMKEFLRNHAIAYMWDDHDYCGDNTNSTAAGRTNARLTYQEYVPHYPLAAGAGDVPIYQSFSVGRIRFILSDLRSEKTAAGTSIMGATQKAWFKSECIDAKNNNQVIVWISSVPWGGTVDMDTWAGFTAERTELSDFFKTTGIQNMLIICGDAHMIAFDDGTNHDFSTGANNPFKYPVLQAAAVNQTGSFRGGTFSHGFFSNPTQQHGQYAALTITDDGGNNISVGITGYRVDSAGSESVLLTYTINFPVLNTLPVTIGNFSVKEGSQKDSAVLTWQAQHDVNTPCKAIVIERSNDGNQFAALDTVNCNGRADGQYWFIDKKPYKGKNFYRLKIIHANNEVLYSAVRSIEFAGAVAVDVLNNPVHHQLQLAIYSPATAAATYTLVDTNGRTITTRMLTLQRGSNQVRLEVDHLPAGLYFFNLQVNNQLLSKQFLRE